MGPVDRLFDEWFKKEFGNKPSPEYRVLKYMFAAYLVENKTEKQIWGMLCGPANGPCRCNCLCPPGIAWNTILEKKGEA